MAFAELAVKFSDSRFHREFFNINDEESAVNRFRKRYKNADLYRSIFDFDIQSQKDIEQVKKIKGPLCFDFDANLSQRREWKSIQNQTRHCLGILKNLLYIPAEYINIYFSGAKGIHVVVPETVLGLGYQEHRTLVKAYKDLALYIKTDWEFRHKHKSSLDLRIYDKRRIFRLCNSINSKTNCYKILVPLPIYLGQYLSYEDIVTMSKKNLQYEEAKGEYCPAANQAWNDLFILNREPVSTPTNNYQTERQQHKFFQKLQPCIINALLSSIETGNRNNVAIALSNALLQHPYNIEEVKNIVLEWNNSNPVPLPYEEIQQVIASASTMMKQKKYYGCAAMQFLGFCDPKTCTKRRRS